MNFIAIVGAARDRRRIARSAAEPRYDCAMIVPDAAGGRAHFADIDGCE
jgi:hypothetical protein